MKAFSRLQQFPLLVGALAAAVAMTGCVPKPETGDRGPASVGGNAVGRIDDLLLVDCLLPGQIRQLGTQMTYLSPRRHVKTTKSDCGIRGGEFVLFDRSDYKTALQTLLPQAQSGDAVAQTYVGEIYEKGLGLPGPDYANAAHWYREAAKGGHRPAQTNLGLLHERGLGVAKSKSEALKWYRQAIGLTEDRLVFESKLKAERAAFQREIAVRNRVAQSLRQQLKQAKAPRSPGPSAQVAAPVAGKKDLERVAESLSRDAASAAEQKQKALHAVQEVKKSEGIDKGGATGSSKKAAQTGKLELSKAAQIGKLELDLRQEFNALVDNRQRLERGL